MFFLEQLLSGSLCKKSSKAVYINMYAQVRRGTEGTVRREEVLLMVPIRLQAANA